ncbi:MAG: 1-aminocyclopropane-1-carboxylate deaminase, partial [Bacteroidia bacterium]
KMMFGIYDLIKSGYFENGSTILALHTGGLQGWEGMKYRGLI